MRNCTVSITAELRLALIALIGRKIDKRVLKRVIVNKSDNSQSILVYEAAKKVILAVSV